MSYCIVLACYTPTHTHNDCNAPTHTHIPTHDDCNAHTHTYPHTHTHRHTHTHIDYVPSVRYRLTTSSGALTTGSVHFTGLATCRATCTVTRANMEHDIIYYSIMCVYNDIYIMYIYIYIYYLNI